MSETVNVGYNTLVKAGGNTFAGVTQDDFSLSAEMKESITKADAGSKRTKIVRVPASITVAGLCSTDSGSTVNDREAIIDLVLAKASVAITYLVETGLTYSGTGYLTGYKESTAADPDTDPTYSVEISIPNGLTKDS